MNNPKNLIHEGTLNFASILPGAQMDVGNDELTETTRQAEQHSRLGDRTSVDDSEIQEIVHKTSTLHSRKSSLNRSLFAAGVFAHLGSSQKLKTGTTAWKEAVKYLDHRPTDERASAFENGDKYHLDFRAECETYMDKICERHFDIVKHLLVEMNSLEETIMQLQTENGLLGNKLAVSNGDARQDQDWDSATTTGSKRQAGDFVASQPSTQSTKSTKKAHFGMRLTSTVETSAASKVSTASICSGMPSMMANLVEHVETEQCPDGEFELWPSWTKREKELKAGRNALGQDVQDEENIRKCNEVLNTDFAVGMQSRCQLENQTRCGKTMRRIMISPNHVARIGFWDPVGFLLVVTECIYIPLQFFPLQQGLFQQVLIWISRIFWTLEIPLSFITGYQKTDGTIVLSPEKVAKRYIKSWFLLDLGLTTIDWMELYFADSGASGSALRIGKATKTLRMLRTVRLARVIKRIKLPDWLSALVYLTKSDAWKIGTSIFRIVLLMIVIVHFLACMWFGIAYGRTDLTWLTVSDIEAGSLWYQYWTAYHWALTQFCGSSEVVPVNIDERIFNVVAAIVAFFGGAIIISTITSQMTHWDMLTAGESARVSILVDFLVDHEISRVLTMKIVKSAQMALEERKKNTMEQNIDLLQIIPLPLKLELHHSLYMPSLDVHPFLSRYNVLAPRTMQGVCHHTLTHLSVVAGSILFAAGEVPPNPKVYLILSGQMVFVRGRMVGTGLLYPKFLCEAALWSPWFHRGTLLAKKDTAVLAVDVEKFQEVVNASSRHDYTICLEYGRAFLQALNTVDEDERTDLYDAVQFNAEAWLDENYPTAETADSSAQKRGLWLFKRKGHMSGLTKFLHK